jgi:hypothetical protein
MNRTKTHDEQAKKLCKPMTERICGRSILSIRSRRSILSYGSTGSILSIGSAGSILSSGSAGSILSVLSIGSILSIVSVGSLVSVLAYGRTRNRQRRHQMIAPRHLTQVPEIQPRVG